MVSVGFREPRVSARFRGLEFQRSGLGQTVASNTDLRVVCSIRVVFSPGGVGCFLRALFWYTMRINS